MTAPNQKKFKCNLCGKFCSKKMSHFNKNKHNYCSNECRYSGRTKDVDDLKIKVIELYDNGLTAKEVAKKLDIELPRLYYHLKKWKLGIMKCYKYNRIMMEIGRKKREKTELNFMERYKNGEVSWRQTHRIAERVWDITSKPCEVCGWEEAERDMHLKIPRLLEKENAISLCPNHHRLAHRGVIII